MNKINQCLLNIERKRGKNERTKKRNKGKNEKEEQTKERKRRTNKIKEVCESYPYPCNWRPGFETYDEDL
jgi:hypothetical protein